MSHMEGQLWSKAFAADVRSILEEVVRTVSSRSPRWQTRLKIDADPPLPCLMQGCKDARPGLTVNDLATPHVTSQHFLDGRKEERKGILAWESHRVSWQKLYFCMLFIILVVASFSHVR